ncbi:hypothetical protein [Rhodococcus jostii]|uniref:hypothetical protein n=1 Tax=Rhodococcus jostii TaxID=132919 RepID=UPI000AB3C3B8|nr:hypothetical protein [Rhodococcus jostii]
MTAWQVCARVTVPLASVMLADTRRYFDHLTRYQPGDTYGFVEYVARSVIVSSEAVQDSAHVLRCVRYRR